MEQRKNIHNNYLILNGKSEEPEHYSVKMILEKSVPNILPLEIQRLNNDAAYYYDITGLQTVKEFIDKKLLDKELVRKLLSSILKQLAIAKEFLLEENNLLLTTESIFIEPISQAVFFCYQYNYNQDAKQQITDLIEYFLEHVDYEDKAAVLLVYGLYKTSRRDWNCQQLWNVLNNKKNPCTIENSIIKNDLHYNSLSDAYAQTFIIDDTEETDDVQIEDKATEIKDEITGREKRNNLEGKGKTYQNNNRETRQIYSKWVWVGCVFSVLTCLAVLIYLTASGFLIDKHTGELYLIKLIFSFTAVGILEAVVLNVLLRERQEERSDAGKTENKVLWVNNGDIRFADNENQINDEATIILAKTEMFYLCPFDNKTYQEIKILEFPFFIGKLKSKVDGMIESRSVSRFHARIDEEDGYYYVTDLNSTNGTFLNGQRIYSNEKSQIRFEDVITFANVDYKFICK